MAKIRFPALSIVATATILAMGCASKSQPSTYRTDESLIENFRAHRARFNTLLEMFREDKGLIYFSRGGTVPQNPESIGVGQGRFEQYRRLFSEIGLEGMAADERVTGSRDEVWFFTSVEGARPGTLKHYAYVSNPEKGVVQDLDNGGSKSTPYRHIEGNWYLTLDDAD